jgi:flavin reductase (DIM6/NTAB) family NADH-FMN oxidoreductase RutF
MCLSIPTVDMIDTVVAHRTCSGSDIDKFTRFGLTGSKAATSVRL